MFIRVRPSCTTYDRSRPVSRRRPLVRSNSCLPPQGNRNTWLENLRGNYVIYQLEHGIPTPGNDLWVYDITTQTSRQLTSTVSSYDHFVEFVDGYDAIVFQRSTGQFDENYLLQFGLDAIPGTPDDILTQLDSRWTPFGTYLGAPKAGLAGDIAWSSGDTNAPTGEIRFCDLNQGSSTPCNPNTYGAFPIAVPANGAGQTFPVWPGQVIFYSQDLFGNAEIRTMDLSNGNETVWIPNGTNYLLDDAWGPFTLLHNWPSSEDLVGTLSSPLTVIHQATTGRPGAIEQGGRIARNIGPSDNKLKMARLVWENNAGWIHVTDPLDASPTSIVANTQGIQFGWTVAVDGDYVAWEDTTGVHGALCVIP